MGSIRRNTCIKYEKTKTRYVRKDRLFEDKSFPANAESIGENLSGTIWKRPKEICEDPQFTVAGSSRLDLHQGQMGNCWFVAAAATLASKPELLEKVIPVPEEQSFQDGEYAGMFRFKFWWYGEWKEVIIDDRLPVATSSGRLRFCQNRSQPNEFWGPLLEKAYAKLHGSYYNINGGKIQDALVDMTGGASEIFDLEESNEQQVKRLYRVMLRLDKMNCLMGCSIKDKRIEDISGSGFRAKHAYSITKLARVKVENDVVKLLRVRDPYGPRCSEWKRAWSENSSEWDAVDDETKAQLEVESKQDGEFWMALEDWKDFFSEVQICYLTPQSAIVGAAKKEWFMMAKDGQWVKGVSSGGTPKDISSEQYLMNPKFPISLSEPDPDDEDGRCTLVVSLMKKHQRRARHLTIGYRILQMKSDGNGVEYTSDQDFKSSPMREVCGQHHLEPGDYCIVPSTLNAGDEAEFFLRIVTEKHDVGMAMLGGTNRLQASASDDEDDEIEEIDTAEKKKLLRIFDKYDRGSNEMIDAAELLKILRFIYKPGTIKSIKIFLSKLKPGSKPKRLKFTKADCNILVSFWGMEDSGRLSKEEFLSLYNHLQKLQSIYSNHSSAGVLSNDQLEGAYIAAGLRVESEILQTAAKFYGGKQGRIDFTDFICSYYKIQLAVDSYTANSGLSQTQWIVDQLGGNHKCGG